uniref:M20_dimer domain-containing protein n=1 Tax=Macrostomum lignano TaxID=282301 RepID=A0A1I8G9D2_9PLAT
MSANADLQRIFSRIDANQSRYIDRLRDAVAVRSVSAWPDHRGEVVRMKLTDGTKLQLPPCLLADLPSNANSDKKKTLLIYGHLDVQPAAKEDGWDTEPFELTERNGNLYGRGSSDDKGPVLGWLNAVEAYKEVRFLVIAPEEEALYDKMDFSVDEFKADNGLHGLLHASKHRWRFPSLSVHGIEGAFYGEGAKTVIPRRVIGKFSIRIVPNQTPDEVNAKVVAYCERLFRERGSPNQCRIIPQHGGRHWFSDFQHPHFQAAAKATKTVYGVEPDMTREGGSIPVTLSLQESTGKNVLLLPMGQADDGAHSQNEKLSKRNYIQGTKLMAAYLHEVGQI